MNHTFLADLAHETPPPTNGILSRTVFQDDWVKAVAFGFAAGEELSEHTASLPAILQFVQGEATLTVGDDSLEAQAGTWLHMTAGLKHSIRAKTPTVLLLLLLKK